MVLFDLNRVPSTKSDFALRIDHTVLKPSEGVKRVFEAVEETEKYGFRALVAPPWVIRDLRGVTKARLATVISFPHGNDPLSVKEFQVEKAIDNGVDDVDIVINVMALLSGKRDLVVNEVKRLTKNSHSRGVVVKFIVETGLLNKELIQWVARVLTANSVDYIKTCTGYGPRGVSIDDIILLRRSVGWKQGIKASGGIRRGLQALLLLGYGADVLGTSSSLRIMSEYEEAYNIVFKTD